MLGNYPTVSRRDCRILCCTESVSNQKSDSSSVVSNKGWVQTYYTSGIVTFYQVCVMFSLEYVKVS